MKGNRIAVLLGLAFTALTLRADITLDLGPSTENFTLTGRGDGGTFGTWNIQQGSCGPLTGTVTCTLSGAITSGTPGYDSGTYSFVTTFLATDLNPTEGISVGPDPGPDPAENEFYYDYIAPSVSMVLDLTTPGGDYEFPMFTSGAFVAGFSFAYTGTETCTGLGVGVTCDQAEVGVVAGATISGPVTLSIDIPTPAVPEPSSFILLSTLLLGAALVTRKRWARR